MGEFHHRFHRLSQKKLFQVVSVGLNSIHQITNSSSVIIRTNPSNPCSSSSSSSTSPNHQITKSPNHQIIFIRDYPHKSVKSVFLFLFHSSSTQQINNSPNHQILPQTGLYGSVIAYLRITFFCISIHPNSSCLPRTSFTPMKIPEPVVQNPRTEISPPSIQYLE